MVRRSPHAFLMAGKGHHKRANNAAGDRLITPRGLHVAAPKCSAGLACTLIMNHVEILIKTFAKCFYMSLAGK
jgi:hypothetical protein